MADYDADFSAFYNSSGNKITGGASTTTISDGDAGSTDFESTDNLTLNGSPTAFTYTGTYTQTIGGVDVTFIVLSGSAGQQSLFANLSGTGLLAADVYTALPLTTVTPTSTDPFTVCFAAGTLIATPGGERTVETLAIGDLITTADGRAVPVKWIGRQSVQKFFAGERARPVRVAAGALGDGLPHTDLVLTADHALIFDGLAINAGALVNGTTITLDPLATLPERVTYYHVETENHEVILANGAAAETFVDYVTRQAFDNYAEYVELYGEQRVIEEMDRMRIAASRLVPSSIRNRLAAANAA